MLQVYGVARQMLSLVAGGAIDEYILSQLKALRQEHQLARLIHSLQISLWPGGVWFQRLPERQIPVSLTLLYIGSALLRWPSLVRNTMHKTPNKMNWI